MTTSSSGLRMDGKVALVTGGAQGIGEATVRRFVAEGSRVIIADLDDESGQQLAGSLRDATRFIRTDVRTEADIEAAVRLAVDEFGRLDVMFNNAGIVGFAGPITDLPIDDFDRTVAVNLRATLLGIKHAARVMIPQQFGSILSTASIAAVRGYGPHGYAATKAGVVGLTRSAAAELWPHNIRVNSILPGSTDTPMRRRMGSEAVKEPLSREQRRLLRDMDASEIAAAAVFLLGDEATFITGESLIIDGGLTRAGSAAPFSRNANQVRS